MASPESLKLIALFESMKRKEAMTREFETGERKNEFESPEPPREIERQVLIEKSRFKDSNLFHLSPEEGANGNHILYLHGGGYVDSFTTYHWQFLAGLTRQLKCTVTAPDYPLAPEHPYPDAFDMVTDLYKEMAVRIDPQRIYLMGDSAGGGLCLALVQRIRDEKGAQPQEIFLLSPWLDLTLTNPDLFKIDPLDPFLSVKGCQLAGESYAGQTDPSHPFISPINGEFHELPRINIFAGSRDILTADARKLAAILETQRHAFGYDEFEGMFHVWMLFDLPETQQLIEKLMARLS